MKFLFILLLFVFSCDSDDSPTAPAPSVSGCTDNTACNFNSFATFDDGPCLTEDCAGECGGSAVIDECGVCGGDDSTCLDCAGVPNGSTNCIDATSYHDWIYFSLDIGEIVDISEPESSMDWDIAFQRNNIKTNGGLSGSGDVCAIVDDTQLWTNESFESTDQIPNEECQVDVEIIGITDPGNNNCQGCYSIESGHQYITCVKNPALNLWGSFLDCFDFTVSNYQFFVRALDGNYVKIWLMSYHDIYGQVGNISMKYLPINR